MLSVTAPPVPAHARPPLPNQAVPVGHIAIVLIVVVRGLTLYLNVLLLLSFVVVVMARMKRRVRIMTLYMIDNSWLLLIVYMLTMI